MRMPFWLKAIRRRLTTPQRCTRRARESSSHVAIIEMLEPRTFLSATPVGAEVRVNTNTSADQSAPVVATDNLGNYVVTWVSYGQDGSGSGIYAQRYSSAGVAQGSEFRVNTFTSGDQATPSIAMDVVGNFVITWSSGGQDGRGAGIYAQRYDFNGLAQGSEFRVNTYTENDQSGPAIAMDSTGDFVITWVSHGQVQNEFSGTVGADSIYAQRFSSAGVAQGPEFKVNSVESTLNQSPTVAMDAAGDFVVAWSRVVFDNVADPFSQIAAKRYDANAVVVQDEFVVTSGGAQGQVSPTVSMSSAGSFVVAWYGSYDDAVDDGVMARKYNSDGTAQTSSFQVNTYITGNRKLAACDVRI